MLPYWQSDVDRHKFLLGTTTMKTCKWDGRAQPWPCLFMPNELGAAVTIRTPITEILHGIYYSGWHVLWELQGSKFHHRNTFSHELRMCVVISVLIFMGIIKPVDHFLKIISGFQLCLTWQLRLTCVWQHTVGLHLYCIMPMSRTHYSLLGLAIKDWSYWRFYA